MLGHKTMRKRVFAGTYIEIGDARTSGWAKTILITLGTLVSYDDQLGIVGLNSSVKTVLYSYLIFSIFTCVCAEMRWEFALGKLIHWIDLGFSSALIGLTGGTDSLYFIFLFLPVFTSSLRWGLVEGRRVTLAAVVLYLAFAVLTRTISSSHFSLRIALLLSLGLLVAQVGASKLQLRRRLALLQSLGHIANPRLGLDRTLTAVLEKTRAFFGADRCIALLYERDSCCFTARTVATNGPLSVSSDAVSGRIGQVLLPEPREHLLLHRGSRWTRCRLWPACSSLFYDEVSGRWIVGGKSQYELMADLLETSSFISVPLTLCQSTGRIFLVSRDRPFARRDALFLAHIAAEARPLIETIELLDRIASEAASAERQKISLDLHDATIQPYIGLKLGLAALSRKAGPHNPVACDVEKLLGMAGCVIEELRAYAGNVRLQPGPEEPICLAVMRRQAARVLECYGVHITIDIEGRIAIGDRLAAEVLHIVREGLSNICRHTTARRGAVRLWCTSDLLRIEITNENYETERKVFVPRSINERAAALGGTAFVQDDRFGSTAVWVEIPV
jgi:signal transduction histidine kinase